MKDTLWEVIGEIVLTLVFFGIGANIIRAFGVKLDSEKIDGDLIMLIGIVVCCAIFAIIFASVKLINKIIKK